MMELEKKSKYKSTRLFPTRLGHKECMEDLWIGLLGLSSASIHRERCGRMVEPRQPVAETAGKWVLPA